MVSRMASLGTMVTMSCMSFGRRGLCGSLALWKTDSMYGGEVPKAVWPERQPMSAAMLGSRNISTPFIIIKACLVGFGTSNSTNFSDCSMYSVVHSVVHSVVYSVVYCIVSSEYGSVRGMMHWILDRFDLLTFMHGSRKSNTSKFGWVCVFGGFCWI